ncbi:HHL268Cp [Eremothecium sinecaudum]|uniref:Large ribosomal subunit protein uL2m n=1 Tax=Eremothecium sinecaudum TaxID=45286 RepID=A0A109UYC1_9SACH|nr:HHL268Cp [Eremothecium sinecaudum]AMD22502.1 HHL268Cp [Eremothecium sinecaudum]
MLMANYMRCSLTLRSIGLRSQFRLFSSSISSRKEVAENQNVQSINAVTARMLKIVPDTSDMVTLEKQDELIRRKRKLAKDLTKMKKMKPVSPGLRWYRAPIYPYLHKGKPVRKLTVAKRGTGGRNNTGKITVRHRGGGHKRRIRLVDFYRKDVGPHTVQRIEYDPGRTAHIALLKNNSTEKLSYILACEGLREGDVVESFRNGISKELMEEMGGKIDSAMLSVRTSQKGNCLPISMIPIGSIIHNIGVVPNGPGKFCRSAGAYGRLLSKIPEKKRAIVRLQSGEERYVSLEACATLGIVSNIDHQNSSLGKAGRSRWRGIRPSVRGVAMNKCDHPHGGGRGKSKSNKLSMSPWGQLAKGYKTRRGKNQNRMKVRDRPRGKRKSK